MEFTLSFNKKIYQVGEEGEVTIQVDNSQCSAPIQNYSFRIKNTSSADNNSGETNNNAIECVIK